LKRIIYVYLCFFDIFYLLYFIHVYKHTHKIHLPHILFSLFIFLFILWFHHLSACLISHLHAVFIWFPIFMQWSFDFPSCGVCFSILLRCSFDLDRSTSIKYWFTQSLSSSMIQIERHQYFNHFNLLSLIIMHCLCKVNLHMQSIRVIKTPCHIKIVGWSEVIWRNTWLLFVDSVK
jgi:hypothetical protein